MVSRRRELAPASGNFEISAQTPVAENSLENLDSIKEISAAPTNQEAAVAYSFVSDEVVGSANVEHGGDATF